MLEKIAKIILFFKNLFNFCLIYEKCNKKWLRARVVHIRVKFQIFPNSRIAKRASC